MGGKKRKRDSGSQNSSQLKNMSQKRMCFVFSQKGCVSTGECEIMNLNWGDKEWSNYSFRQLSSNDMMSFGGRQK